jgi:hypothetical protein
MVVATVAILLSDRLTVSVKIEPTGKYVPLAASPAKSLKLDPSVIENFTLPVELL